MLMPNIINCKICDLMKVTENNVWVIEQLFQYADVKKYYVLRDDHAANIRLFCRDTIVENQRGNSMNFIIYNQYGNEVGFISAELAMNRNTNQPMWNVGYAILPNYRKRGFASDAVNGLTEFLLQNFSIQQVMLDISTDNAGSEAVAKKCGFKKLNDKMGYVDMQHMEVGMRFRWFKELAGNRTVLFNQAVQHYRLKQYSESVRCFEQALNEPYQPGTPFIDAQIYSNMGMAYSSLHAYREAYQSLLTAKRLGLTNASIEKELTWLRTNCGF